ncbi:unnamed protein product [Cunninghamella blakesleeana]
MSSITIPQEYRYVLAASAVSVFQLFFMGAQVGRARSKAKVPYPYVYAERAEAEKDDLKNKFNCTQRIHQNSLELFPPFIVSLLIGGLKHPLLSSTAAAVYILGRFVYAINYSTGEPQKRVRGAFAYFGLLTLFGTSISTIISLLK